jgi:hypothetical protein
MPGKATKAVREAVARLAYELYLRRGGEHGHDVEDWITAERMLEEKLKGRGKNAHQKRALRRVEDKSWI